MPTIETTIHAIYEAIEAGDGAALTALVDDKVRYTVPGANRFAGTHTGRDEFFAIVGELAALTGGTLRNTAESVFVGDGGAVVVQRTTAQRDGQSHDMVDALLIEVDDGRVTAITEYAGDPVAFDKFLS